MPNAVANHTLPLQVSLLGSVLSNLLLVLGTAFLVGGWRYSEQTFNQVGAKTNSGMLMLIVMALVFPAVLDATHEVRPCHCGQTRAWPSLPLRPPARLKAQPSLVALDAAS